MPWVALMAGVMALVSTTPWGSMRRGVGGRADAGGGGGGKKAAPAPKPAPKAAPKPAPKPAPAPAYKPAPAPAPKPAPAPAPRARFDDEPAPPIPPRFDTEPDPPPLVTATATKTPTPVATVTPAPVRTPKPTATVTPGPASIRALALAGSQSAVSMTLPGTSAASSTGAAISPLFWDQNARFNGAMHSSLTIVEPKFTLDRGRPGDVDMNWAEAPGPAVFFLVLDQFTRILLPYANANAMAAVEPNVHADIYYNAYPGGVRIPGVVVENQSREPIWVEGVAIGSRGTFARQVPTASELGESSPGRGSRRNRDLCT